MSEREEYFYYGLRAAMKFRAVTELQGKYANALYDDIGSHRVTAVSRSTPTQTHLKGPDGLEPKPL